MDDQTLRYMGLRVDRARGLIGKITELKREREHFAQTREHLGVECGSERIIFVADSKWREAFQQSLTTILGEEIAELEAELAEL